MRYSIIVNGKKVWDGEAENETDALVEALTEDNLVLEENGKMLIALSSYNDDEEV